jgi:hypothetical protein
MHAIRCEGSPKIFGLSVVPYDVLPGMPNRTEGKGLNCCNQSDIYAEV